ncbi:MAG: hypothetical protein WA821_21410, partial [Anaerolineales bacterium]
VSRVAVIFAKRPVGQDDCHPFPAFIVSSQYFGGIAVDRWFRYGSGTAPLPTQPPIIEKIPFI